MHFLIFSLFLCLFSFNSLFAEACGDETCDCKSCDMGSTQYHDAVYCKGCDGGRQFIPFFRDGSNDSIIRSLPRSVRNAIPDAPMMTKFDEEVLNLCGGLGTDVDKAGFIRLLNDPKLQGDVDEIYRFLDGTLGGGDKKLSIGEFKEKLAEIWFEAGAFRTVMCGVVRGPGRDCECGGLAGLHFSGRFLQLQKMGVAGISLDDRCTYFGPLVSGRVYKVPLIFFDTNGFGMKCDEGYVYGLNSQEIIKFGTKLYVSQNVSSGENLNCVIRERNPDGSYDYDYVVDIRDGKLVSLYPVPERAERDYKSCK